IVRLARELAITRGVVEDGWYAAKNGNDFDLYMAKLILNALLGNIDKKGGLCFQESTGFPPAITSTADRIVTITGHKLPPIKATRVDRAVYPEAVSQFDAVLDAVIEEKPYPVKALFIVATSPIHRDINHEKLFKALEKLELVVTIDILPQDHVDWSDYVLPDLMFLERKHVEGIKWTLHPGIWLNSKILDPPPGVDARDSFWALMEIVRRAFPERAALVDYTEKYADPHTFEEYEAGIIEAVLTSLAKRWGVKLEDLKTALERDGFYVFKQKTYEVRPYKTPLGTPSGKVEIYALRALRYKLDPLPDFRPPWYKLPKAPDEFYLVNGKDNTISAHVVFTKNAKYIVEREVWMSPVDAARLGIKDGDLVELEGLDNGYKAAARVKVTNRVKPGVLYTHAFAGGRKSVFITGEYSFLKDGVNPSSFASHKPTPVIGAVGTNASVRVRKL
ncbi:MAG: molybdopterin dinucleotide binding domain-containing protein, partial [Pyrobaculum sp.]